MSSGPSPTPLRSALQLLAFLVLCLAVGWLGSQATVPSLEPWYAGLRKPGFTPPDWVFGPVWTALYIAMAVAAWLTWRSGPGAPEVRAALRAFFVQLAFNALWSWAFFWMQSPAAGLVVILLLDLALIVAIRRVFLASAAAAWLLVPYLLWVLFATALNASILALN